MSDCTLCNGMTVLWEGLAPARPCPRCGGAESVAHDSGLPPELRFPNCKAGPLPAASPWVKIEPGCEMPEVGAWKRSGPLLGRIEEHGDERVVVCHYSQGHKYVSDGFKCYGAAINPTHYAVVRMPEETTSS